MTAKPSRRSWRDVLPIHPATDLFPPMTREELIELGEDIKKNGLIAAPVLWEAEKGAPLQLLDGRNRLDAMEAVGLPVLDDEGKWLVRKIDQQCIRIRGGDPYAYVLSLNLHRRHLTAQQKRKIIAAVLKAQPTKSNRTIAKQVKADDKTVGSVRRELEATAEVPQLTKTVGADGKARTTTPKKQRTLDDWEADKRARQAAKAEHRATLESELAAKIRGLPNKRYGVIYADAPLRFEPWSRATGMDRAADNHYPTMNTEDICQLAVPSIAADHCVLFLCATAPMLPHALKVMAAWGFTYRSQVVWDKGRAGTGYWFRNRHELLLVGTRGKVPAPAPGTQWESVVAAPKGAHSAKPECFYKLIETYFPNLPKIELFARGPGRLGWDVWGNEAEERAAAAMPADDDGLDIPPALVRGAP